MTNPDDFLSRRRLLALACALPALGVLSACGGEGEYEEEAEEEDD